jgi:hypothetical protein
VPAGAVGAVGAVVGGLVGQSSADLVAGERLVGFFDFEVGGGGVSLNRLIKLG